VPLPIPPPAAGAARAGRVTGAALAAVVVALAAPATPAAAHPFGPPSTARISVDGSGVAITWLAAEDDWVALGQSVGAFEDPTSGAVATELTGEQKLQRSTRVHDYLLERITVRQGGSPCPGRLATLDRLLSRGARLSFDCPVDVVDLDVTVGALTDLNEAYRTMLISETPATPERTLFTAAETTRRLRFAPGAGGLSGTVLRTAIGTGTALVAAVALLVAVRLRRRARSRA
jgi:hypothetical protein